MSAKIVRTILAWSLFVLAAGGCSTNEQTQPPTMTKRDAMAPQPKASTAEATKSTLPTMVVLFTGPVGAEINWSQAAASKNESNPADTGAQVLPSRHDFAEQGVYRLRISKVPNHEGMEFHPVLEIAPLLPRFKTYLANHVIPVEISEGDLAHLAKGVVVCKVVYLSDENLQKVSEVNCETLVSWSLAAGVDPVIEADRRGTILATLRIGPNEMNESPHAASR